MKTNLGSPRVTVLMAVYNSERFLRQAIESILRQTFTDFEFLIVNDGSTDGSRDAILNYDDPRIRMVDNQDNVGLTKSLNKGLALARGQFVARLDADDISHPSRLVSQVAFLDQHREIALVGTHARVINQSGSVTRRLEQRRPETKIGVDWYLLFGNPFVHSSVMFRRNIVWNVLGGYDEHFRYNQDFELWSRLLQAHDAVNMSDTLVDFRSNSYSITRQRGPQYIDVWQNTLRANIGVQQLNVLRILGCKALAEEWPEVWSNINVPEIANCRCDPNRALALLDQIYAQFVARNPTESRNAEVIASKARILARIARYAAATDRTVAVKALLRGLRVDFLEVLKDVPPIVATICFGVEYASTLAHKVSQLRRKFTGVRQ